MNQTPNHAIGPIQAIRLLVIEDHKADFLLAQALLAEVPHSRYEVDWAATYEAGLAKIHQHRYDACLVDYHLGERNGLDFLRAAAAADGSAPFILFTGSSDAQIDAEALRAGAFDFLVKGQTDASLLERTIRYAIAHKQAQLERDRLIATLRAAAVEIQQLRRLLPICAHCKRIRDDRGFWSEVETYFTRLGAQLTHGICPHCASQVLAEFEEWKARETQPAGALRQSEPPTAPTDRTDRTPPADGTTPLPSHQLSHA
jgi:CheY-like chemotaxis protein